jgi:hypothetical protein
MSYNKDSRTDLQGGIQCFRIQGELFHYQGPLRPGSQETPQFAQLFFYDPDHATDIRARRYTDLNRGVLGELNLMLQSCNPFITLYKTADERLREERDSLRGLPMSARMVISPQMRLVILSGADRRRENLPTSNEVAAIIPDEYEAGLGRDIILADRDGGSRLHRIPVTHAAYMPLHYVLLFPCGEPGWHWGLTLRDQQGRPTTARLEQQMFHRYRLHVRRGEWSAMFYAGRLFQQYIVDCFVACETTRLQWLRNNQEKLRADLYKNLTDHLHREDVNLAEVSLGATALCNSCTRILWR